MNNSPDQMHRSIAWFNTLLLAIVIFFMGRLVTQFDSVAKDVGIMSRDIALVKAKVDQHSKEIDKIQSLQNPHKHETKTN